MIDRNENYINFAQSDEMEHHHHQNIITDLEDATKIY